MCFVVSDDIMENPIEHFLKSTGWSCDDLLKRLQEYKSSKECENRVCQDEKPEVCEESTEKNLNILDIDETVSTNTTSRDDESLDSNVINIQDASTTIAIEDANVAICEIGVSTDNSKTQFGNDSNDSYKDFLNRSSDSMADSNHTSENKISLNNVYSKHSKISIRPFAELFEQECSNTKEEKNVESLESIEDVRNNLKLQLSSLRNRKKKHALQELTTKIVDTQAASNIINKRISLFKENSESKNEKIENEQLIDQTNEFGLVILNVEGGVNFDDNENNLGHSKEEEDDSKPTVFDQIRKIIRKSKSTEGNLYKELIPVTKHSKSQPTKPLSAMNTNVSENIPKELKLDGGKSPFVSNELDEFLTADSRLNISYNVPKSGAEEGLNQCYRSQSPEHVDKAVEKIEKQRSNPVFPKIKAKTLAEKRKLLEKQINLQSGKIEHEPSNITTFNNGSITEIITIQNDLTNSTEKIVITQQPINSNTFKYNIQNCVKENAAVISKNEKNQYKMILPAKKEHTDQNKNIQNSAKENPTVTPKKENVNQSKMILPHKKEYTDNIQICAKENSASAIKKEKKNQSNLIASSKKEFINPNQVNFHKKDDLTKYEQQHKTKKSYVLLNDKKIFVPSLIENQCLLKITEIPKQPEKVTTHSNEIPKKLSLLGSLGRNFKLSLKPGPLCKKKELIQNINLHWTVESKVLPKVMLEVMPEVGKPINPKIAHLLPKCDGRISKFQVEYALSALVNKQDDNKKFFTFGIHVPYINNQKTILVRKPIEVTPSVAITEDSGVYSDRNDISAIIEDMLVYVELKEIEDTLIKEDPESPARYEECNLKKTSPISKNVRKARKNKIDLELFRLSCKVVNVNVEESSKSIQCEQLHCKFGCVCQSLKCETIILQHCKKIECMFNCNCPKKSLTCNDLILPTNDNLLNSDTFNRIEETVKKNLAKVEREFTQTVIHANDKTIVLGSVGRNKSKRISKTPKKFEDYIETFDDKEFLSKGNEKELSSLKQIKQYKDCFVESEKLNVDNIIPFCWNHLTYKCTCLNESPVSSPRKDIIPVILESSQKEKSLIHLPDEFSNKSISNGCARFQEAAFYKNRNKVPTYYSELLQKIHKLKFLNKDLSSPNLEFYTKEYPKPEITDAEFLAEHSTGHRVELGKSNKKKLQIVQNDQISHKRKQTIIVKDDHDSKAIQRRKKPKLHTHSNSHQTEPLFNGELLMESGSKELLSQIGRKTLSEENTTRLLPWRYLLENFYNKNIQIWCLENQPYKLLISKFENKPPPNYIEISQSKHKSDVITWILTSKLPTSYSEENMFFILKKSNDYYELRGICSKNENNKSVSKDTHTICTETDSLNVPKKSTIKNIADPVQFLHKDIHNRTKLLNIKRIHFSAQKLGMFQDDNVVLENTTDPLITFLPDISNTSGMCKWKVILLKSDFTVLHFKSSNYSIRYTSLIRAVKHAEDRNSTVVLYGDELSKGYQHRLFGVYFVPNVQDKCFVGPYMTKEESQLETLRYINKKLVDTVRYNEIQGNASSLNSYWMIQCNTIKNNFSQPTQFLNLNLEHSMNDLNNKKRSKATDYSQNVKKKKRSNELTNLQKIFEESTDQKKNSHREIQNESNITMIEEKLNWNELNNFEDLPIEYATETYSNKSYIVLDSVPKNPYEFNRYIITNIPKFGYLGAYQHEDSKVIDVSWPFENKMLRFSSSNHARAFLQDRFSTLLHAIPETFKIYVLILTNLDLDALEPINAKCLGGHYICGDFGIFDAKTLTEELAMEQLNMSREQILRILAKRAQSYVKTKIQEFARIIDIPPIESEIDSMELCKILRQGTSIIKDLIVNEFQLMKEKQKLEERKKSLAKQAFTLISNLPKHIRHSESLKFRKNLHYHSNKESKQTKSSLKLDSMILSNQSTSSNSKSILINQKYENSSNNPISTIQAPLDEVLQKPIEAKVVPKFKSILKPMYSQLNDSSTCLKPIGKILTTATKVKMEEAFPETTESKQKESPSDSQSPKSIEEERKANVNLKSPTVLSGVKIVKTAAGKLVLVSDKKNYLNPVNKSFDTKIVIQNSKVLSVSRTDAAN